MSRPALVALVLAVAGCDVTADLEPYAGVVEVSLADRALVAADGGEVALRLRAVEDTSCDDPLVASLRRGATTRTVTVEGIDRPTSGGQCDAVIPASAVVPLDLGPELPGGYAVEVAHAGAVDLYALDLTAPGGPALSAVRTSTTRLAARPAE